MGLKRAPCSLQYLLCKLFSVKNWAWWPLRKPTLWISVKVKTTNFQQKLKQSILEKRLKGLRLSSVWKKKLNQTQFIQFMNPASTSWLILTSLVPKGTTKKVELDFGTVYYWQFGKLFIYFGQNFCFIVTMLNYFQHRLNHDS